MNITAFIKTIERYSDSNAREIGFVLPIRDDMMISEGEIGETMTQPSPAEIQELNLKIARAIYPNSSKKIIERLPDGAIVFQDGLGRPMRTFEPCSDPAQAVEVAEKMREFVWGGYATRVMTATDANGIWSAAVEGITESDEDFCTDLFEGPFALSICLAISAALAAGARRKEGR